MLGRHDGYSSLPTALTCRRLAAVTFFLFFGESLFDPFLPFLSFAPNCPLLLLDTMRLRVGAAAATFAAWN